MTQATITRAVADGALYLTTTARGTQYTLMRNGEGWFVSSHRLALGRQHIGGGKCYATLEDVAAGCKAFGGLDSLLAAVYGLGAVATA